MTKFYRSDRRRGPHRRLYIIVIIALLMAALAGAGYYVWKQKQPTSNAKNNKAANDANATKYVSFGGQYVFSIPAGYQVDETLIRNVVLVYAENSPPKPGMKLDDLYKAGVIAIQPITDLKDNNPKVFKEYVNNKLANDLRKSTRSNVDVREAKQGTVDALKVFALAKDGKRLKAMYAVNFTKPILMVAADETNALKIVGSSMEEAQAAQAKADIEQATQTTQAVLQLAVQQNATELAQKSVAGTNKAALAADLASSAALFDRPVTIFGGSYNGKAFVAQFIFEPKTKEQTSASGAIGLKKENNAWKLETLQLPEP